MVEEKINRNLVFLLVFIFFLLAVGGLFILKPKLTGFAVLDEYENQTACEEAGYTWENLTEENCTNITTCVNETIEECECLEYEVINETTNETECINWSSCEEENCTDEENCTEIITGGQCVGSVCGDGVVEGDEVCDDGENNGEYGYCLTNCSGLGLHCGDAECNGDEDCANCPSDCGECDEESESETEGESTTQVSITASTTASTAGTSSACSPNWQCGAWSECADETQTRTCEDANSCGTDEGKPVTSQACAMPETCFDGMKNQDETGIDCGGVCEKRCSIFTIVGNTVNVPLQSGKEFFLENKTKSIIIMSVLVLGIAGFVTSLILRKKNIPLGRILEKIRPSSQEQ